MVLKSDDVRADELGVAIATPATSSDPESSTSSARAGGGRAASTPWWIELDGLRALAVLAVMSCHLRMGTFMEGGYLGVDVFFVLSGFLITSLLIVEQRRRGSIGMRWFYARRGLRLLPALAAMMIVGIVLVTLIDPTSPFRAGTLHGAPWTLLYSEDWRRALFPSSVESSGLFGHTWSLSVEEQYYLIWPLVLLVGLRWFGRRRAVLAVGAFGLALAEIVGRWAAVDAGWSGNHIFFGADLHSDGLLLGSGLALLLSCEGASLQVDQCRRVLNISAIAAIPLLVCLFLVTPPTGGGYRLGISLACLLSCLLVTACTSGSVPLVSSMLSCRIARWLGRRSYGLYLWHYVIYFGVFYELSPHPTIAICAAEVGCSLIVAELSWRLIERPFNSLRRRFSR
jgi:peptidoglycan/LPS O-acetylase OafA/YrhL